MDEAAAWCANLPSHSAWFLAILCLPEGLEVCVTARDSLVEHGFPAAIRLALAAIDM